MDAVQAVPDRESWLVRARAVWAVPAVAQEPMPEPRTAEHAEPAAWNPHDVWLHRIHRPRQRRLAEQR
jgi:hypothetical protein